MLSNGIGYTMDMLAPLGIALIVTTLAVRRLIPMMRRHHTTQQIYDLAPDSHQAKADTPTMGGICIIFGVLIACVIAMIYAGLSPGIIITLAVFVCFGAIGFLDDFTKVNRKRNLGLTARQKLIFQIVISLAVALYYVFLSGAGMEILIPFIWKRVYIGYWIIPYIVFIMVAMTNAVNLTDGLDGLASGITMTLSLFMPVIVILGTMLGYRTISGSSTVGILMYYSSENIFFAALAGSCLGFLMYNRYPAKIFMGDTGSLAIGGGIATAAIFAKMELFLPIVGLIFVVEALSVVLQVGSYKLRHGKRIFKMSPLHHHFELSGWKEPRVVSVFVTVTLILCAVAVALLLVQVAVIKNPGVSPVSLSPGYGS